MRSGTCLEAPRAPPTASALDLLVVGAGPYGLAIAHEAWSSGIPCTVVGHPFDLWHRHTFTDAALRSDFRASEIFSSSGRLGLERYWSRRPSGGISSPRAKERIEVPAYREYLAHVQECLPFPLIPRHVQRIARLAAGFELTLDSGAVHRSRAVVIATGVGPHRYLPSSLRALSPARVLHSHFARSIENLSGERILVVGSGQSAGEAIRQLLPRNDVTWLRRHDPVFHADPIALPHLLFRLALRSTPVFCRVPRPLRERLARPFEGSTMTPDLAETLASPRLRQRRGDVDDLRLVESGGELRSDHSEERFDRVVACTGYRPSIENLSFLDPTLRSEIGQRNGIPPLDRHFASSVPGLYFVGCMAERSHGPAQRFLIGSREAARAVTQSVLARRRAS